MSLCTYAQQACVVDIGHGGAPLAHICVYAEVPALYRQLEVSPLAYVCTGDLRVSPFYPRLYW